VPRPAAIRYRSTFLSVCRFRPALAWPAFLPPESLPTRRVMRSGSSRPTTRRSLSPQPAAAVIGGAHEYVLAFIHLYEEISIERRFQEICVKINYQIFL
jgi:hypothetical protein